MKHCKKKLLDETEVDRFHINGSASTKTINKYLPILLLIADYEIQ